MDYGEVLGKAWKIIWKHKVLWIFGILASFGKGSGGGRGNGGGSGGRISGGGIHPVFAICLRSGQDFFENSGTFIDNIQWWAGCCLSWVSSF